MQKWRKWIVFPRRWCLLLVAGCWPATTNVANSLIYHDFSSPAGLILQAFASPFDGRLRLTRAKSGEGIGGAWLDTEQPVKDGFETTFQMLITDKKERGADGLAFAIQSGPTPRLGWPGCNLGFGGLTNLLVIKFKNYHGDNPQSITFDEVAVMAADSPTNVLWDCGTPSLASVTNHVVFSDGLIHVVRILYVPGNLQVYLDDMVNPLMTVYVNLAKVMNLDEGRAWVGFTAACGADWQNQDLLSWFFASNSDPSRWSSVKMQPLSSANPLTNAAMQLFSAPVPAAPEPTPLIKDPAFAYALPKDIGVGLQIEASTDLVHWESLTNAAFYFRDVTSSNYNTRFYRFLRK